MDFLELPLELNQLDFSHSRNRQDKLGLRRYFIDGRQTTDWCITYNMEFVFLKKQIYLTSETIRHQSECIHITFLPSDIDGSIKNMHAF